MKISENECTFKQLKQNIMHLFPEKGCFQDALMIYKIIYALYKSGKLKTENRKVPGAEEGIYGIKTFLKTVPFC